MNFVCAVRRRHLAKNRCKPQRQKLGPGTGGVALTDYYIYYLMTIKTMTCRRRRHKNTLNLTKQTLICIRARNFLILLSPLCKKLHEILRRGNFPHGILLLF